MALYADDVAVFIKLTEKEFEVTKSILQIFEDKWLSFQHGQD
jgi:hypothetical protein